MQGQRYLLIIACVHDNGRIDLIEELHLGGHKFCYPCVAGRCCNSKGFFDGSCTSVGFELRGSSGIKAGGPKEQDSEKLMERFRKHHFQIS